MSKIFLLIFAVVLFVKQTTCAPSYYNVVRLYEYIDSVKTLSLVSDTVLGQSLGNEFGADPGRITHRKRNDRLMHVSPFR